MRNVVLARKVERQNKLKKERCCEHTYPLFRGYCGTVTVANRLVRWGWWWLDSHARPASQSRVSFRGGHMFGGRCRVVSVAGRCWPTRWLFTHGLPGPGARAAAAARPKGWPTRRWRCVEGRSSHDGGQRRGTDDKKAPGAGKRQGRRRERGQRSSNGPETTGEPSYPLAQGGDKEETSPTEATEKEATEVSASDYFPLQCCCCCCVRISLKRSMVNFSSSSFLWPFFRYFFPQRFFELVCLRFSWIFLLSFSSLIRGWI